MKDRKKQVEKVKEVLIKAGEIKMEQKDELARVIEDILCELYPDYESLHYPPITIDEITDTKEIVANKLATKLRELNYIKLELKGNLKPLKHRGLNVTKITIDEWKIK